MEKKDLETFETVRRLLSRLLPRYREILRELRTRNITMRPDSELEQRVENMLEETALLCTGDVVGFVEESSLPASVSRSDALERSTLSEWRTDSLLVLLQELYKRLTSALERLEDSSPQACRTLRMQGEDLREEARKLLEANGLDSSFNHEKRVDL